MFTFLKKKLLTDQESRLIAAFRKVDADISHLRQWVSHLHTKQEDLHRSHHTQVELTQKDIDNITKWLQYLNQHNGEVRRHVLELTKAMGEFLSQHTKIHDRISAIERRMSSDSQVQFVRSSSSVRTEPRTELRTDVSRRPAFEERIVEQARSNRKNYTLNLLLELAEQKKFTTVQIEKLIVEEKRLCGRTTFYAYLKELRAGGQVDDLTVGAKTVLARTGD